MKNTQSMPRPPTGRGMHIYVVSRLYRQHAPKWESMLRELEEDEEFMAIAYQPLRRAIVADLKQPGRGEVVLGSQLGHLPDTKTYQSIRQTSRDAFDMYRRTILPNVASLEEDYVNPPSRSRHILIGEHLIAGGFHAKLLLKDGTTRFAYFHASKWKRDEEEGFHELLTILGEEAFGCDRSEVWFVNLRDGAIRPPAKSYKNLRRDLEATVRHLARFRPA